MKFIRILLCAGLLALPASSQAWIHGYVAAILPNSALSGVVVADCNTIPFVNLAKCAQGGFATNTGTTFVYPAFLAQGTNLPTGILPTRIGYSLPYPSNYFGEYVISDTGTVSGTSQILGFIGQASWGTVYSIGGSTTISGCTNSNTPPCQFNGQLGYGGTNPTITVDLSAPITGVTNNGSGFVRLAVANGNNAIATNTAVTVSGVVGSDGNGCGANGQGTVTAETTTTVDISLSFDVGCTYFSGGQIWGQQSGLTSSSIAFGFGPGTYTSLTSVIMCRLADYNADNTCQTQSGKTLWAGGFSDDYISALATLRPHHIRFLDANNNVFRVPPDWNGSPSTSSFTYRNPEQWFAMSNWFGSDVTNTSSYAVSCSSPCTYTLNSGAPRDGDFFHFYVTNANTVANPTLTITDINSVTSSAIPLMGESNQRTVVQMTGSASSGDTVAMQFNSSCLSGGTHTTSAYTVTGGDTLASISGQLVNIINADATLIAQPIVVSARNPNGSSGVVYYGYANNACAVTSSLVVAGSGSRTETANIGTMAINGGSANNLVADTIYTGIYNALQQAIIVNTSDKGGVSAAWPWSVQMALAADVSKKSSLQVGCWLQPNLLWSNASFTSLVNYANANQCPGGTIFELSNEMCWMFSNPETGQGIALANSVGLGSDCLAYYELRQRQLWGIASSAFGGLSGNLVTTSMFQLSGIVSSKLAGTTLCGTSCGNTAYQNAIGADYNVSPNRPVDYTRVVGEAPYYQGAILNGSYQSSGSYNSWSATSSSVSGNVLTVAGTVTGTIWWNHGISSCEGVYIAAPTPTNPASAQLSGAVTTTLNGAINDNTSTWTLTSNAGLSAGMWVYNQTTGMINGTIGSVGGGNQITITSNKKTYRSSGAHDTIVFGGLAGTYQLNSTTCSAGSGTITGGDILGLQYAADNYNGLNSALGSQQDAFNWMYQDTLVAANNNQMPTVTTIQSMVNSYNIINTVAASYSLPVWDYEGGLQSFPPSTSNATSMGLPSSSYGCSNGSCTNGYIGVLLAAWKNSSSFKSLETLRHTNELALLPSSSMTMWYAFEGSSQIRWGLYPQDLYSTPYQSYNAIGCYNGNPGLC